MRKLEQLAVAVCHAWENVPYAGASAADDIRDAIIELRAELQRLQAARKRVIRGRKKSIRSEARRTISRFKEALRRG